MADATLAADFYARFRSGARSLSERIASFASTSTRREAERDEIISNLAKLRKELVDATPYLPSWDQRQSELQMKKLEQQLEGLIGFASGGGAGKSGSKFAFKRTTQTTTSSTTREASTSSMPHASRGQANISTLPAVVAGVGGPDQTMEMGSNASVNTENTYLTGPKNESLEFSSRDHEYITLSAKSTPTEQYITTSTATDLSLSHLNNCVVNLTGLSEVVGVIRAFHARNLRRCVVLLPYIEGSALICDCEECLIAVGCHQFRIHTSKKTDIYLYVTSTPILEKCSEMRFGPYAIPEAALPSGARQINRWDQVQDFLWLRATPSPHWSLIPSDEVLNDELWGVGGLSSSIDDILRRFLPGNTPYRTLADG